MTEPNEVVASIFERTAKLAAGMAAGAPPEVALALGVGAGLANVVAVLIRSLGIDDTKKAIDELVAARNVGKIGDAELEADDASIAGAVADMYKRGTPKPKPLPDDAFDTTFDDATPAEGLDDKT